MSLPVSNERGVGPPAVNDRTSPRPANMNDAASPRSANVNEISPRSAPKNDGVSPRSANANDAASPRPAVSPRPAITNDAASPRPAISNDAVSPRPTVSNDATSPRPANVNDATSPRPANVNDATSPRPANVNDATSPRPANVNDAASPRPANLNDAASPRLANVSDAVSPRSANVNETSPRSVPKHDGASPRSANVIEGTSPRANLVSDGVSRSPRSPRSPRTPRSPSATNPKAWNDVVTLLRDTRLLPEDSLDITGASVSSRTFFPDKKAVQRHATSSAISYHQNLRGGGFSSTSPIPPLRWVTTTATTSTSSNSRVVPEKRFPPTSEANPSSTACSMLLSPRDLPESGTLSSPRQTYVSKSAEWEPYVVKRRPSAPANEYGLMPLSPREPQLLSFFSDESLCQTFSPDSSRTKGSKHHGIVRIPEYARDGHHPHRSSYRLARMEQDQVQSHVLD